VSEQLTKREQLAAIMLQGMLSNSAIAADMARVTYLSDDETAARHKQQAMLLRGAFDWADAILGWEVKP
jgi:hypothetical protein